MYLKGLLIIIIVAIFTTCNPTGKIAKTKSADKNLGDISSRWTNSGAFAFPYNQISYKSKLNVNAPTLKIQVKLTSHLIQDSLLWASVSKFGLETHQMLLTSDTIKILDRLGNQYIFGSTSQWLSQQGLNLNFNDLQRLWIGMYPRYPEGSIEPIVDSTGYSIDWDDGQLKYEYFFSIIGDNLNRMKIADSENQEFKINQNLFNNHENFAIPYQRYYEVNGSEAYSFEMTIQEVKLNQPKTLTFRIPEKYQRVAL